MIVNKKWIVRGVLYILVFIVLVFGTTYAFFNYKKTSLANTFSSSTIDFDFTNDTLLNVASDFPQDADLSNQDLIAMKTNHKGVLTLTDHNTLTNGLRYDIYVIHGDDVTGKQRLNDSNIMFQLEPDFTNNSNGFKSLSNLYSEPKKLSFIDGKALIASGLAKNTTELTSVDYNFYMWMDASSMHVSSTMKRETLAEGNPSLADTTSGNATSSRYLKNNGVLTNNVTLYPATSNESGKIVYTTNEFSNGYYNIKFVVEAEEAKKPICKRATLATLHTEECKNTYQYGNCRGVGYALNGTITYGNTTITDGELNTGDAFDCDVNDDGVYDPVNERFYYIAHYDAFEANASETTEYPDYAVLISSNNYYEGLPNNTGVKYSNSSNELTPTVAMTHLPKTKSNGGTWRNDLLKSSNVRPYAFNDNLPRQIYVFVDPYNPLALPTSLSYQGYAAKMLTGLEILDSNCLARSNKNNYMSSNSLGQCVFLFENTTFAKDKTTDIQCSLLETNSFQYENSVFSIKSYETNIDSTWRTSTDCGVKPVIEIHHKYIEY